MFTFIRDSVTNEDPLNTNQEEVIKFPVTYRSSSVVMIRPQYRPQYRRKTPRLHNSSCHTPTISIPVPTKTRSLIKCRSTLNQIVYYQSHNRHTQKKWEKAQFPRFEYDPAIFTRGPRSCPNSSMSRKEGFSRLVFSAYPRARRGRRPRLHRHSSRHYVASVLPSVRCPRFRLRCCPRLLTRSPSALTCTQHRIAISAE